VEDLPDWAVYLSLDPNDLAKVQEKLYEFEQPYYHIDGHVFTSWYVPSSCTVFKS
jgi:hypothetical protein